MAVENLGKCIPLPAAGDLSSSQFLFVRVNSSGQAAVVGDGEDADGVLQDNDATAANLAANVALNGRTKVKSGGTVTAGNYVSADSSGRAVNSASGDYILGRAVEGTTDANAIVSIILSIGHATL